MAFEDLVLSGAVKADQGTSISHDPSGAIDQDGSRGVAGLVSFSSLIGAYMASSASPAMRLWSVGRLADNSDVIKERCSIDGFVGSQG